MRQQIKEIYESALKNQDFLKDIWEADRDKKPGFFASNLEKHVFASFYYGWLVGKHGKNWRTYL